MWRRALILSVLCFSAIAQESEPVSSGSVEQTDTVDRLQLFLAPNYTLFKREGSTLSALDIHLGMSYALDDRLALEGGLHQAFSFSGFSAIYTTIEAGISFAAWGTQFRHKRQIKVAGMGIAEGTESIGSALIFSALAKQYFFNGSNSVLPFSGIGLTGMYRFPSSTSSSVGVGLSSDFIANGSKTAVAVKVFGRWSFWL